MAEARFGVFYDHFREECWWWESQTCVRRVLLLTAYVVNFTDLQTRVYWVAIVCLGAFGMHVTFRPFKDAIDNLLEGLALFTLVFASLTLVYSPSAVSPTVEGMRAIVVAILAIVGITALAEFYKSHSRTFNGALRTAVRTVRARSGRFTETSL